MEAEIPYHYCKKCRQQIPVTNWGVGICDACTMRPSAKARAKRHASGDAFIEYAKRRLREASDTKKGRRREVRLHHFEQAPSEYRTSGKPKKAKICL